LLTRKSSIPAHRSHPRRLPRRSLLPLRLPFPLVFLLLLLLPVLSLAACKPRSGGGRAAGGSSDGGSGASPAAVAAGDAVELLFTYGSEKEDWIKEATERFNAGGYKAPGGRPIRVQAVPQGSGESIDDLLAGTRKADLTSPASAAFIRLGNAESRAKTGHDLIGVTQNLVLSPVVIAMWRPMAEALGWPGRRIGWGEVLKLAQDSKGWASYGHPEWGAFRFGHTHPDYSNSGLIALLAETYAGAGKLRGLTASDVASPAVARYVAGIESAVVHYGSSTGFFGKKMFTLGPQYLSAAVLYESLVIESAGPGYRLPFPVVAIYPKEGTFWSDHPVGVVEREWVTPERRQAAKVYVDFLLARPQQERALSFGFRPAAVDVPLGSPIDAAHGVDPKEPQTTLEVPPVEVIDAVRQLFRRVKKPASITLVLDTSGSMNDDQKMINAKAGAEQLLALLDGEDSFSFLPFSSTMAWAMQDVKLQDGRASAIEHVRGVFAHGQTELYDVIDAAFDHQLAISRREPNTISAVVVLTDGEDTNSRTKLPELLRKIRSDNETKNVRIFTIGYGNDARRDVLEQIADATEARFYVGNPGNIRSVFREISTFF
jgi:Ca-activated chloride channel family protein